MYQEVGELIGEIREAARMTQKQVAERVGVHQSRLSRIEAGEVNFDASDYDKILDAIATDEAHKLKNVIHKIWQHLPRPSLKHPSIAELVEIEAALEMLHGFKESDSTPRVLAGQAELLFRRLFDAGTFLLGLDHRVGYVGEIGVGKTTAACKQANLVIDPSTPDDLRGMLLDTGGGRTTLCDVIVKLGDRYSLRVEPLPDEEVYRLAAEFCRSVGEKANENDSGVSSADFRPAEEIVRALRNMAGLPRLPRARSGPQPSDPIIELKDRVESPDEFIADFASRLTLWRRTRRAIEFDGTDDGSARRWLRDTFTAINNGRHPEFSLPEKITVSVPFSPVSRTPFNVTVKDTRGIDGSAVRPDIVSLLKDQRAVTVLCSKWGSAPDPSIQELLKHMVETEVDAALFDRAVILVLARSGDALSMRHDSGEHAEDIAEGYDIKIRHVEDALQRANLPRVETWAFDSAQDLGSTLDDLLISKIEGLRKGQAERARGTISAIDQMLANVQEAQALQALSDINKELEIFATRHATLKTIRNPAHARLLLAVRKSHPRSVWAATRRTGSFWNFDFYQHLGDGGATEARQRGGPVMAGLREIVENKLADPDYNTAHAFLRQLLEDIGAWESDFLKAARHYAVATYRPHLKVDQALWKDCEAKYGSGVGYREEVASRLDGWFQEQENLLDDFEEQLQRAWQKSVIEALRRAAGE